MVDGLLDEILYISRAADFGLDRQTFAAETFDLFHGFTPGFFFQVVTKRNNRAFFGEFKGDNVRPTRMAAPVIRTTEFSICIVYCP